MKQITMDYRMYCATVHSATIAHPAPLVMIMARGPAAINKNIMTIN